MRRLGALLLLCGAVVAKNPPAPGDHVKTWDTQGNVIPSDYAKHPLACFHLNLMKVHNALMANYGKDEEHYKDVAKEIGLPSQLKYSAPSGSMMTIHTDDTACTLMLAFRGTRFG